MTNAPRNNPSKPDTGTPLAHRYEYTPTLYAAKPTIANIERRYSGRLGIFAVDTGSGRTLSHRADERFLMCSTFKGVLVAQVPARVDTGKEQLDRLVHYTEKDLIFTSPVTKANLARGVMSVGELCQATLEESDNTAAILLMRSVGGPAALTQFLRGLGDTVTRSDRYEPESNQYKGVLDTTAPRAIVTAMRSVLLGNVLSPQSRAQLESGMIAYKPWLNRLRAMLPADWVAADRPRTGLEEESNDYALVRPPGRAPLLIAAYYDAPGVSMDTREAVLREAGTALLAKRITLHGRAQTLLSLPAAAAMAFVYLYQSIGQSNVIGVTAMALRTEPGWVKGRRLRRNGQTQLPTIASTVITRETRGSIFSMAN